jgi:hypothetical protein
MVRFLFLSSIVDSDMGSVCDFHKQRCFVNISVQMAGRILLSTY